MLETTKRPADYYSQLSQAILVEIRGTFSQMELSTKLGYSFNQVGKWESGATIFHWQDFTDLNEALNIPWQKHFQSVFSFHSGMDPETTSVFEVLSHFFGHASINEMAEHLHKSRSSISRLLHNQVKIDFADVLRVMDQRGFVLTSWLAKFLKPQNISMLKERFEIEVQMARGLISIPWAQIVNCCLHLQPYLDSEEHSSAWIAEKAGISQEQVEEALQKLTESGVVEKRGQKYHSYVFEMTMLRIPEYRSFTRYLTETAAKFFRPQVTLKPNYENPSLSSSRIYPLSKEGGKKVADALVLFHHQLSEILKNDQGPKDHVRAVLIHSLDLQIITDVAKSDQA